MASGNRWWITAGASAKCWASRKPNRARTCSSRSISILQVVAELALNQSLDGYPNSRGAVVALNPQNGEILAMASRPNFDPNKFAVRIKSKDWKELTSDPGNPLLNRAIQAQWAPGSTFKPIVALAGLESGSIDEDTAFQCPGGASFFGHYYKCWGVHGTVSLHKGMSQSCDSYFYNVGNKTGIDNIAYYADQAGLGHKSGVDLPNEAAGTVPSPEWKLRNFRQKWFAGETISVSIGQGALTVTPLQLARAIGGLAAGGVWHIPHLLLSATKTEKPHEWALNPENVHRVVYGTYGVVNEGGTGVRARIPGHRRLRQDRLGADRFGRLREDAQGRERQRLVRRLRAVLQARDCGRGALGKRGCSRAVRRAHRPRRDGFLFRQESAHGGSGGRSGANRSQIPPMRWFPL